MRMRESPNDRSLSERSESKRPGGMPIRWLRRRLGPVWGRSASQIAHVTPRQTSRRRSDATCLPG